MCLADTEAKKLPTPTEKLLFQNTGLGFKKIKFDIKAEEVTVYNQLTGRSKSDRNSTEDLAGYSKLQKCGGIEVLNNEVHTKLQSFRTFRLPNVSQKS